MLNTENTEKLGVTWGRGYMLILNCMVKALLCERLNFLSPASSNCSQPCLTTLVPKRNKLVEHALCQYERMQYHTPTSRAL